MIRRERIAQTLEDALTPLHLDVTDESYMHNVPEGAESHFKVLVVSTAFAGQSLIQRHRRVHDLLEAEFSDGLHALTQHTWTPEEWFEKGGAAPQSPPCLGGSASDAD